MTQGTERRTSRLAARLDHARSKVPGAWVIWTTCCGPGRPSLGFLLSLVFKSGQICLRWPCDQTADCDRRGIDFGDRCHLRRRFLLGFPTAVCRGKAERLARFDQRRPCQRLSNRLADRGRESCPTNRNERFAVSCGMGRVRESAVEEQCLRQLSKVA